MRIALMRSYVPQDPAGEYRQEALKCRAIAKCSKNRQIRAGLLELAMDWLRLAEQAEGRSHGAPNCAFERRPDDF